MLKQWNGLEKPYEEALAARQVNSSFWILAGWMKS